MSDTDLLAEIEKAIDAVAPPAELRARLEALADLADAPGETGRPLSDCPRHRRKPQ